MKIKHIVGENASFQMPAKIKAWREHINNKHPDAVIRQEPVTFKNGDYHFTAKVNGHIVSELKGNFFKDRKEQTTDMPVGETQEEDNGPYKFLNGGLETRNFNTNQTKAIQLAKHLIMQQDVGDWGALVDANGDLVWKWNPKGKMPNDLDSNSDSSVSNLAPTPAPHIHVPQNHSNRSVEKDNDIVNIDDDQAWIEEKLEAWHKAPYLYKVLASKLMGVSIEDMEKMVKGEIDWPFSLDDVEEKVNQWVHDNQHKPEKEIEADIMGNVQAQDEPLSENNNIRKLINIIENKSNYLVLKISNFLNKILKPKDKALGEDGEPMKVKSVSGDEVDIDQGGTDIKAKVTDLVANPDKPGEFQMKPPPTSGQGSIQPGATVTTSTQEEYEGDPDEDHPSYHHFKNWIHSEHSPYSDEAGDDKAVFLKALHYLDGKEDPANHEFHAHHMTKMFHGGVDESHRDLISQGDEDVGGDPTGGAGYKRGFINDIVDKDFERKNRSPGADGQASPINKREKRLPESDELMKWLTIAGVK